MSEDSKLVSIKTMAQEFSKTELQEYANKQHIALTRAQIKIKELEEEVSHLKTLLTSTTPLIQITDENKVEIITTPEKEIVETQIQILKRRSLDRELSFEDTKKLETLVRTAKLIDGEKIIKTDKSKSKTSDEILLALASQNSSEKPSDG
jgi:hypothetical protein